MLSCVLLSIQYIVSPGSARPVLRKVPSLHRASAGRAGELIGSEPLTRVEIFPSDMLRDSQDMETVSRCEKHGIPTSTTPASPVSYLSYVVVPAYGPAV